MKISDLRTAGEIHQEDMHDDPEYAAEYERTRFANEVAIMVVKYRAEHGLSQSDLARELGMRQPNVARLESGEHEPSISTLSRLSRVLDLDFSVDLRGGRVRLRQREGTFRPASAAEVRQRIRDLATMGMISAAVPRAPDALPSQRSIRGDDIEHEPIAALRSRVQNLGGQLVLLAAFGDEDVEWLGLRGLRLAGTLAFPATPGDDGFAPCTAGRHTALHDDEARAVIPARASWFVPVAVGVGCRLRRGRVPPECLRRPVRL